MSASTSCFYMLKFTWKIQNFKACKHELGEYLPSPMFEAPSLKGNTKWMLRLYPKGNLKSEFIAIHLQRVAEDNNPDEVVVDYEIFLQTSGGTTVNKWRETDVIFLKGCSKGNECAIYLEAVFKKGEDVLLSEDTLTVRCNLVPKETSILSTSIDGEKSDVIQLTRDFWKMYNDHLLSDVILHVGDESLKVHKSVLFARCPELVSELNTIPPPNDQNPIHSNLHTDIHTLKALVRYLYTGEFEKLSEDVFDSLLELADKYQIFHLNQRLCASVYEYSGKTRVILERNAFRWYFQKFSYFNVRKDVSIPFIVTGKESGMKWKFNFSLKLNAAHEKIISISIEKFFECSNPVPLRCEFGAIEANGETSVFYRGKHIFIGDSKWHIPYCLKEKDIIRAKSTFLPNDLLTLCFQLTSDKFDEEIELNNLTRRQISEEKLTDLPSLTNDLRDLFTSQMLTDVTFVVGDKEIFAHKSILSARSEIFYKIFESDASENKSVINVVETDTQTVNAMLLYLYSGQVEDLDFECARKLFVLADKYCLQTLMERCSTIMIANLNADNALCALNLASNFLNKVLNVYVMNYILDNANNIFRGENWKNLIRNNADLMIEIIEKLAAKCTFPQGQTKL